MPNVKVKKRNIVPIIAEVTVPYAPDPKAVMKAGEWAKHGLEKELGRKVRQFTEEYVKRNNNSVTVTAKVMVISRKSRKADWSYHA